MKRLSLLDTFNLRTSSVYSSPRNVSDLQVVLGDYSSVFIPCTPIDKEGRLQHISDMPMQWIGSVQVDGNAQGFGYTACPAYQDETGRSIACLLFDAPQYDKKVSVSGKGAVDLSTGDLIENPADIIKTVLLRVQGYNEDVIDAGEIARFKTDCLKNELKARCILDSENVTLKAFFDELALNLHAHWLLSDGKSVMGLRGSSSVSDQPIAYKFSVDTSDTSVDLANEIALNYGYNPAEGKFNESITKHNPLSKGVYDVARASYDLKMISSARQAEATLDRMLRTYSVPQIITSFVHDLRSYRVEPGDRVAITDPGGIAPAGGYVEAPGEVVSKEVSGLNITYSVAMDPDGSLYSSELLSLSQASGSGKLGVQVSYDSGTVILNVFTSNSSYGSLTPMPGAAVTVNGSKKTTDIQGNAHFDVSHGTYRAVIEASGYETIDMTFTV